MKNVIIEKAITVEVDAETRLQLPVGGPYELTDAVAKAVLSAGAGYEIDEDGKPVAKSKAKAEPGAPVE
jgi:hypothetical protein